MQANTKAKTISHCKGKGSLGHNNRTFKCKNVDGTRTANNITFVKQTIQQAYEECFGTAVERYNAKQKRNDRKIDNYYKSVFDVDYKNTVVISSDKRKSFYEDVVGIGDMHDTAVGTVDGKIAAECLTEYMSGFSKRNPNFHVFSSHLHLDEATPHLHIDYIPIGHYKRGVDTQNGMAQALSEMGYGNGKDSINKWRLAERKVLEEICNRRGINIAPPKKGRGHTFTVDEYKEREEKSRLLSEKENDLRRKLSQLEGELQIYSHRKLLKELIEIAEKNDVFYDKIYDEMLRFKVSHPQEYTNFKVQKWEIDHISHELDNCGLSAQWGKTNTGEHFCAYEKSKEEAVKKARGEFVRKCREVEKDLIIGKSADGCLKITDNSSGNVIVLGSIPPKKELSERFMQKFGFDENKANIAWAKFYSEKERMAQINPPLSTKLRK